MRLFFLVFLSITYFQAFSQIRSEESEKDRVVGIYRVKLRENYNDKEELYYSTFFDGDIIIRSSGNTFIAKKLKTNKPYFNIIKSGATYIISDNSEISRQEGSFSSDLFQNKEIKLKLSSTDKDHFGWYSVYTLQRITDKRELYKNVNQGTGFFISSNGYILTNNHVVENGDLTTINIADREYECEIIFTSEKDDIALMRAKDTILHILPLSFSMKDISVGDEVLALGFPLASKMGKELKMSSGMVNSKKGFQDDERYFQLSAPIDPGNSGGPVLDNSGNLVGIITAKYSSATNVGYALNLNSIMKNISNKVRINKETKPKVTASSSIYSKYKNSIVLVKTYSL